MRRAGNGREPKYEGFVFAYEITREHFALKLFRALPVAFVRLRDIVYVRQRSGDDVRELIGDGVRRPFRSFYWPHPILVPDRGITTPYVIRTRRGRRIYVRLGQGYHYRLREAVGRARAEAAHEPRRVEAVSEP